MRDSDPRHGTPDDPRPHHEQHAAFVDLCEAYQPPEPEPVDPEWSEMIAEIFTAKDAEGSEAIETPWSRGDIQTDPLPADLACILDLRQWQVFFDANPDPHLIDLMEGVEIRIANLLEEAGINGIHNAVSWLRSREGMRTLERRFNDLLVKYHAKDNALTVRRLETLMAQFGDMQAAASENATKIAEEAVERALQKSSGKSAKPRRGRPKKRDEDWDAELVTAWEQAHSAGVKRDKFVRERGLEIADLERAQRAMRGRRRS